ncbi:hypothetical protein [Streptomyces sp. NPDC050388]
MTTPFHLGTSRSPTESLTGTLLQRTFAVVLLAGAAFMLIDVLT